MENCNMVCNPIMLGCKLTRDKGFKEVNTKLYKQIVGCLMYLIDTRAYLTYVVCFIERYMKRPTEMHMAFGKRVLMYLKSTLSFGMMYEKGKDGKVLGWSDSDYLGDIDGRVLLISVLRVMIKDVQNRKFTLKTTTF